MGKFVAELKLCKELFVLTGWDDIDLGHTREYEYGTSPLIPRYTLGYLFRKLPHRIASEVAGEYLYLSIERSKKDYYVRYWHIDYPDLGVETKNNSPENACVNMAILLNSRLIKGDK